MTLPPLFQQDLFNSKYKEEPTMSSNVRPATMERITTPLWQRALSTSSSQNCVSRSVIRKSCWPSPAVWTAP